MADVIILADVESVETDSKSSAKSVLREKQVGGIIDPNRTTRNDKLVHKHPGYAAAAEGDKDKFISTYAAEGSDAAYRSVAATTLTATSTTSTQVTANQFTGATMGGTGDAGVKVDSSGNFSRFGEAPLLRYGVVSAVKPVGSPFTKATRTFTIPAGWVFRIGSSSLTNVAALSVVLPNAAGDYIVYLNTSTLALNASLAFPAWSDGIAVARVIYSTVAGDEISMGWENHGLRDQVTALHYDYHHKTVGMLPSLAERPLVAAVYQATTVGITTGRIWDEEKESVVAAKTAGVSAYAKFYYSGLTPGGKDKLERFPVDFSTATPTQLQSIAMTDVDLGVGSTGRACFNNYTGLQFTPTAIASTSAVLRHVFANDGILDTSAIVMGQVEYTGANFPAAVAAARAGALDEVKRIRMSEGSARDSLHLGSVILNASGQIQYVDATGTNTVVPSVTY